MLISCDFGLGLSSAAPAMSGTWHKVGPLASRIVFVVDAYASYRCMLS